MAIKVWGAGSTQGSDGLWDTASNWDLDTAPVDGDSLLFNETATYTLTSGPASSSVIIENIQVTSLALPPTMAAPSWGAPRAIIVTGQLNSASTAVSSLRMFPHGVTSIVGPWAGYMTIPNDRPGDFNTAYLGISEVVFDSSNYLELFNQGYGAAADLQYGISDTSLTLTGQAPFTSFKILANGSGSYGMGFGVSGVTAITSQLVEFGESVIINPFFMMGSTFNLNCPLINITQMGALCPPTGGSSLINIVQFTQACVLNISSNSTSFYPMPINDNLIFNFNQPSVINLYGEATMYGTYSPSGMMGGGFTQVILQGSTTVNCYDNSLVGGIYYGNAFVSGNLENYSPNTCSITMRDNSIFQGMIIGGMMGSTLNFLDSSNVSFAYDYNATTNQFSASPSFISIGQGAIPQTPTGLTIFKSSF
jgi:hypothetical protein